MAQKPIRSRKFTKRQLEHRKLLRIAMQICGSQKQLGDLCDYTQQGISQAFNKGNVSFGLAMKIHEATEGAVNIREFYPQIIGTGLDPAVSARQSQ